MDRFLFLAAMLLGATVLGTASYIIDGGLGAEYTKNQKLIEECQKELPRNQKCKLIAVPENQ